MRGLGPFDVVFCRNVLIYFDVDTRKKILHEIYDTLFSGGWLLLGVAETTLGLEDRFERKTVGQAVSYQSR
jgi:chemotaxis protein methyltransferase CheR